MKKNFLKKEQIINALEYILAFAIILESNTVYSQLYGKHILIRSSLVCFSIISIVLLLFLKKFKFEKKSLSYCILCWIISLLMFINTKSLNGIGIITLIFLLFFPLLYFYFYNYGKEGVISITKKIVNIVIILCVISLLFWLLSSLFNIIEPTGIMKVKWGTPYSSFDTYFYLHFDTQKIYWLFSNPIVRNTGIFTEGPMYSLILVIALMFNVLINKSKYEYLYTVILCITLLTTFSITGYLSAIVILSSYFIKIIRKIKFKKINIKNKIIYITLLALFILILLPFIINIIDKKMDTGSANHRGKDIVNGINMFIKHPILGQGIIHDRDYEENPKTGYGYSNAIIPIATDGGIFLLIMYLLFPINLLIKSIKKKNINYILFVCVFIILLFTTLFQYRMLIVLLIIVQNIFCKDILENKKLKKRS